MQKITIAPKTKNELEKLYKTADTLLKSQRQLGIVACKAGCSACCTSFMWFHVEILHVLGHIKSSEFKKLRWLKQKIKPYDKIYNDRFSPGTFEIKDVNVASAFDDLECIFLHKNKCIIYNHRPLVCRLAMSETSKGCNGLLRVPDEYQQKSENIMALLSKLNEEISMQAFGKVAHALPFRYII